MAVKNGSSWPRSSSSETSVSRKALSRSPVIGKVHATASWDTACRKGSEVPASSGARRWRAASAAVSSPVSTAIIAAVQASSARDCGSSVPSAGRSCSTQGRAWFSRSSRDQNSHKTRNRWGSGPRVMGQVPAHRGGQVARLGLQPLQPIAVAGAAQWPVRLLGQRPVVAGVPPGDLVGVGPGRQPLGHELADGLQHPRPGPGLSIVHVDQAVPGQRLKQLQRPVLIQARHLGGRRYGPPVCEHRRDLQQRPLGLAPAGRRSTAP